MRVHILFFSHHLTVSEVRQTWLDHNVVLEVENPLKIAQRHVEHEADTAWQGFQEPDVCHGRGQLDVAHTLTAHFLQRNFDAALFADNAAIFHALVFAAQAFIVFDRAKDTRTEQAVTLRFERTVVDGFGLLDLTERPREDALWRSQRDLDLVKCLHRSDGVERVVCQFLVHFQSLDFCL